MVHWQKMTLALIVINIYYIIFYRQKMTVALIVITYNILHRTALANTQLKLLVIIIPCSLISNGTLPVVYCEITQLHENCKSLLL